MAPSPENDNAPKAPDKNDKTKSEKAGTSDIAKENDKDEKTLSNLNDGELKALLDEAINYKNPKDREGKSKLFKDLLNQAEETERIARATSAGGSEVARHYNTSAARRHHGRHGGVDGTGSAGGHHGGGRHHGRHRKPSSISENMMHGGSLDNLAKEELFLESTHHLVNKMKTVSARQREGGSLPCDVNSSVISAQDYHFLEEAKKSKDKAMKDKEYTAIDIDSHLEAQRLLDHDSLAENYQESQEITIVPQRYTSKATIQISATPADDAVPLDLDNVAEKKPFDLELLSTKVLHSKYNVYIPTYRNTEERKVDENGNALHQNPSAKAKKKKIQTDKNVVVLTAESVEGHRSDIINDVDKLIQYVLGDKDDTSGGKSTRSNIHKSKQLHKQHASEDSGRGGSSASSASKKQRAHSSKGKESRPEIKKSNSLGEISTVKLEDFAFSGGASNEEDDDDSKVVLRGNKNQSDRPKERRSWGNVEPPPFQILSSNASTENLETAENWVVSKTKKKSKKRRNSVSSSSRRQTSNAEAQAAKQHSNRAPSPDFRGKSMPHSEKSDSSDADSVHSLPIEGINVPVSYADIAKNAEKAKEKKNSPEKVEKVPNKDKSPKNETESNLKKEKPILVSINHVKSPPDVNSVKNFPAISTDVSPKSVPPPDVNDTKSFPAMPVELHNLKSPPIVSDNPLFPPDVNDTKSFPAMPSDGAPKGFNSLPLDVSNTKCFPTISSNNNRGLSVEKTNVKNASISAIRNVSPSSKGACAVTALPIKGTLNNNNVNNNVKIGAPANSVCGNDIQNDLTIIHSNEKDSIQFNAQMLPPNIPDVQTIEKMHFMNCHPQHPPQQHFPPSHQHYQQPPPSAVVPHYPAPYQTASESTQMPPADCVTSPPTSNKNKQADCDMSDRTMAGGTELGGGKEAVEPEEDERPPPVVILSGLGNKEVTGLVFGFDVNEQLLHDDICENFIARFVTPQNYTHASHNHDKIVNFIGSAWEAIINQSNGKVQYYTEDS